MWQVIWDFLYVHLTNMLSSIMGNYTYFWLLTVQKKKIASIGLLLLITLKILSLNCWMYYI